jgi:Skp family chaperone for outer membrane proteins
MEFAIMKRTTLGMFALAIATVSASTQAPKEQSTGPTRVAVVDIGYVFNRFGGSSFKSLPKSDSLEFRQEFKKHRDNVETWEKAIRDRDFANGSVDQLKAKIVAAKTQMADLLRKRQEDSLVQHWQEIQIAIKAYANENKIDLVLGYGELVDKELRDQFPNVSRKMEAMNFGGVVPLFAAGNTDISNAVVEHLQKRR